MNLDKYRANPSESIGAVFFTNYRILLYQAKGGEDLAEYINMFGFYVDLITDIKQMWVKISKVEYLRAYDLVVLDYKDGKPGDISLISQIRAVNADTPIVLLADDIENPNDNMVLRIDAFREGADDVILRPFNIEEFIYRLRAILRRCKPVLSKIKLEYSIGTLLFNTDTYVLTYNDGTEVKLRPAEGKILSILCAYMDRPVPRAIMLYELYGSEDTTSASRKQSFSAAISSLKNKLKPDPNIIIKATRETLTLRTHEVEADPDFLDLM